MKISDYPVIEYTETRDGQLVPVLDIPMMSDERWEQITDGKEGGQAL